MLIFNKQFTCRLYIKTRKIEKIILKLLKISRTKNHLLILRVKNNSQPQVFWCSMLVVSVGRY